MLHLLLRRNQKKTEVYETDFIFTNHINYSYSIN